MNLEETAPAIKETIEIEAPKSRVWQILFEEKYLLQWYEAFSKGSKAQTDWKEGSKAFFTDDSHSGLIGKIISNKPEEFLSIEYQGIVGKNGSEDYESADAKGVKGGMETYRLTENNGITTLNISCDISEKYFDMMSAAWKIALKKIKTLAEGN